MKQNTTTNLISQTIGLDLGDKRSVAVVLAPSGEVLEELKLQTTRASLDSAFGARPACRIALEVGTHSAWIAEQLASYGHEVLVANPRKVHLIGRSRCKSDRNDAESLARLARMGNRARRTRRQERQETRSGGDGAQAGVDFVRSLGNADGF